MRFINTSSWNIRLRRQYTYLFDEFDPSGTDGEPLPADTEYTNNMIFANYNSDSRKKFFFELSTRSGEYFNGARINLSGSLTYRYTPWGFASINFSYYAIRLPSPYSDANLYLVGPRFDLTMSKSLFFTTFFQYNSQLNNLNINARLQWRFKPVSDIFFVYTDNYVTESFTDSGGEYFYKGQPRLRGFVFKISYWLNM